MSGSSAPSKPSVAQEGTSQSLQTEPPKTEIPETEIPAANAPGLSDTVTEDGTDFVEFENLEELRAAMANLQIPNDWHPLPRDPNTANRTTRAYLYRGTVLLNFHLLFNAPQRWARFRARPSDVLVASFPKLGTTWLQEIVWRVVHCETGPESGGGRTLEYRFPLLDLPAWKGMPMEPLHGMKSPRLIKTHLMYHLLPESLHDSGAKVLYITRDPRDVCVSYYHFQRMVEYETYRGTFAEFREKFMRGEVMNGPYREHVKGYLEHADTVLCVSYEKLHDDRVAAVRKIADFLGRHLSDSQTEDIARFTSFEVMKKNPGCNFKHWDQNGFTVANEERAFMRKGETGDWRNHFTQEESERFMKWRNEPI